MFVEKLAIGQPTLRAGLSGVGSVYLVYAGSTVGFMWVLLCGFYCFLLGPGVGLRRRPAC